MRYVPLLAMIKYGYIKRLSYLNVRVKRSDIIVLKKFKNLGLCGFVSLSNSTLRISLNYHFQTPITGQILTFSTKRHKFITNYQSLVKLTQVSPSIVFILSTSYGVLTHYEALKLKIGGYLIASFI